jgi:outer membrane protein assembly factor BamB
MTISFSTAESPWPMAGHDPQYTCQSSLQGAQNNGIKWTYDLGLAGYSYAATSIAQDGTVYVAYSDGKLYAINKEGGLKWTYFEGGSFSDHIPAIGSDGTIYAGKYCCLYAINPDGTLKWQYDKGDNFKLSSPKVNSNGVVYVASVMGNVYAIDSNGNLKWSYATGWTSPGYVCPPSIGYDGSIYVMFARETISNPPQVGGGYLFAIDPQGNLEWSYPFPDAELSCSPSIGKDGTIYVATPNTGVHAINPSGTLKWVYSDYDVGGAISTVIAKDETIICNWGSLIYGLDTNGQLKWKYSLGGAFYSISTPSLGIDGTMYVHLGWSGVFALNPDGTEKWSYLTGETPVGVPHSPPSIGLDNTTYIVLRNGKLYAFGVE